MIVSRAPFLLHGDRFFDSDEAVEGLMASHVLQGEHPAFLWGQRYKGVPEVYLAAAVFAVAGPERHRAEERDAGVLRPVRLPPVRAGRAAVLAGDRVDGDRVPDRLPARRSCFWSLSANAEVVMTLLAGTVMCLGIDIWRRTGSRPAFMAACAAAGFGLWVQQYILYYWIALALADPSLASATRHGSSGTCLPRARCRHGCAC